MEAIAAAAAAAVMDECLSPTEDLGGKSLILNGFCWISYVRTGFIAIKLPPFQKERKVHAAVIEARWSWIRH